MLQEKTHIDEIVRFHSLLSLIDRKIDAEPDDRNKGELARLYYKLTKLWSTIDDFIEFTLKSELDQIDNDISNI